MKVKLYKLVLIFFILFILLLFWRTFSISQSSNEKQQSELQRSISVTINSKQLATAAQRLAQVLRIPTISAVASQEFLQLHNLLKQLYPQLHRHLERRVINDYSLLYHWPGSNTELAPIVLIAHLDVVAVSEEEKKHWQYPPFSGVQVNNEIWGRGALDDKSALISLFEAVTYLIDSGFKPQRSIYIALTHDEESQGSGARAIAAYLHQLAIKPKLIFDEWSGVLPGEMLKTSKPVALVAVAEKGYMDIRLTVKGNTGHSSRPPKQTAIDILSQALLRLQQNPMPSRLVEPVRSMFIQLAPEMNLVNRFVLANTWLLESLLLSQLNNKPESRALINTSFAVTLINGGQVANQLPLSASAVINVRLLPGTSTAMVLTHVKQIINNPAINISVIGKAYEPSPVSTSGSVMYHRIKQSIQHVFTNAKVVPGLLIGTTDSRHFSRLQSPVYRFRAFRLNKNIINQVHGINERISLENLANSMRFYTYLLYFLDFPE